MSQLIGKDPDAGKDWGQEEKGVTEDEMVGWHHRLNGREFEQSPAVGDRQGGLACCSPQGCKEPGTTERLNNSSGTDTHREKSLWRWRAKMAVCQEGWETAEGLLCRHLDLTLLSCRLWDTHSLLFKPPRRWDSDGSPSSWRQSPSARGGYMKTCLCRKQKH